MASNGGIDEWFVKNHGENQVRLELDMKINIVKKDIHELKLTMDEMISEAEIKTKRFDLLSTEFCEKSAKELIRELELLHTSLFRFTSQLKDDAHLTSKEQTDPIQSFQKKLTISVPETDSYADENFEFDGSPGSGQETLQFIERRRMSCNSDFGNSAVVTETGVSHCDYDYEADLKWKDSLFNFHLDSNNKVCEQTNKVSLSTANNRDTNSTTSSGIHSGDHKRTSTPLNEPNVSVIYKVPSVPVGTIVFVSTAYIINPSLFWLHFNPQTNEEILTKLQKTQNLLLRTGNWRVKEFRKKMFVAAMYSKDNFWYRAQVTNILGKNANNKEQVEVRYIDYGNSEILSEDDITVLSPEFFEYEEQAVRCCLTHVSEDAGWSTEKIDLFKMIIEGSASLTAYFFGGVPDQNDELLYSVEIFDGSKSVFDLLSDRP